MVARPFWTIDAAASLAEEARDYVGLTPEERVPYLRAALKASARMLAARPDVQRVLEHRDPLPASTVAALARLRIHDGTP